MCSFGVYFTRPKSTFKYFVLFLGRILFTFDIIIYILLILPLIIYYFTFDNESDMVKVKQHN